MCKSKSRTFLAILALSLLALSQLSAWPSLKKQETPIVQQEPAQTEQVQEQNQEALAEPEAIQEPIQQPSPENALTESDKTYLTDLSTELKTSLEESTREIVKVKAKDLELLLAELESLRSGKAVMDAAHSELEEGYKALDNEYNALVDAYAKSKRGKLMLGVGSSFDIDSLSIGAGMEAGYMGENYYTTIGVDKAIYSIGSGLIPAKNGYELSLKFGLLF